MKTIAINKEVFDFNCTSELTAKNVQEEIRNYLAPQLNDIISKVISVRVEDSNKSLNIDKIEVDLGDMSLSDFGKIGMLDKFRLLFEQYFEDVYKRELHLRLASNSSNIEGSNGSYRENNEVSLELRNGFELLETFVQHGDVPWWVDKNNGLAIDVLTRELLLKSPVTIKTLLKKQLDKPDVLYRIASQFSHSTLSKIEVLIPGLIPISISSSLKMNLGFKAQINFLSKEQAARLKKIFKNGEVASEESHKLLLLNNLFSKNDLQWIERVALLDRLSAHELETIRIIALQKDKTSLLNKAELVELLKKLSVYQIEFLLSSFPSYQTSIAGYRNQGNDQENNSVESVKLTAFQFGTYNAPVTENSHFIADATIGSEDIQQAEKQQSHDYADHKNKLSATNQTYLNQVDPNRLQSSKADQPQIYPDAEYQQQNLASKGKLHDTAKGLSHKEINETYYPADVDPEKKSTELITTEVLQNEQDFSISSTASPTNNSLIAAITLPDKGGEIWAKDRDSEGLLIPEIIDDTNELQKKILVNLDSPTNKTLTAAPFDKNLTLNSSKQDLVSNELFGNEANSTAKKQIVYISKCLESTNAGLRNWLNELSKADLYSLKKTFAKNSHKNFKYEYTIKSLIEHPLFFKYNLFNILNCFVIEETANKARGNALDESTLEARFSDKKTFIDSGLKKSLHLAKENFLAAIEKLKLQEKVVLQDVLQKQKISTQSEKNILHRIMQKLPHESMHILSFLTDLPEDELKHLLSPEGESPSVQKEEIIQEQFPDYVKNEHEKIYIENAGLCLIAMYLPGLFLRLGYIENKKFKNKYAACRALYLIQYLVTGKSRRHEYLLQLNKLLCGFRIDSWVAGGIRLTKQETAEADNLLQSVIDNWKALKNTSVQGFRESFLLRKGIIIANKTYWTLQVERKGYDLLLNTIPWGFQILKLPWMKKMVQVEW